MGRMGRARPHFFWRRGGWGGVKYFKSNAKVSLAHSHPPSHIIRNTKENQLLLRRLLRLCVYIYMQIFAALSYILSYIFICLQIGSYVLFLYLLLYALICFALLFHIVPYIFPYVLILLLYIPRDFPICSNRFQYFWV